MANSNVNGTPVANRYSTQFGSGSISIPKQFVSLAQYRLALVDDMAHKAIRMEVSEFADRFLPLPSGISFEDHPEWPTDIFSDLAEGGTLLESDIADRFRDAINTHDVTPGMQMASSPDKPELDDMEDFKQKIDAAFYRDGSVPTDGRPHWADQLVSVEFKRHETNKDPFDDRVNSNFDATADERKKVRGQIITYAEVVFRVQQRTFLFMLLVIGRNFRLLRWDRSGTIVTRAIDYVAHPHTLCELLWRISLQSDEGLGLDPSATRLHPGDYDYKLMDFYAQPRDSDLATEERTLTEGELASMSDPPVFKYVRLSFRISLAGGWPRYRLEVPHADGVRKFLVCKPLFYADGMVGRGTRGYVALDCLTQQFVWLKDAWRVYYKKVVQEGAILQKLNDEEVDNVPTLLCHGDIRQQTTQTSEVWEEAQAAAEPDPPSSPSPHDRLLSSSATLVAPRLYKPATSRKRSRTAVEAEDSGGSEEETLRRHIHYRIVVREVALPLSEFTTGQNLVSIIVDALQAHRAAFEKAAIMHRDVSGGNILIYPSVEHAEKEPPAVVWQGLLCDWEMGKSTKVEESFQLPSQPPRTGTWQFLSADMLSGQPKAVEIPDELESFLHVLLYYAVRYLNSNCPNAAEFLESYFDAYTLKHGEYVCGQMKEAAVKGGILQVGWNVPLEFDSPLDDALAQLLLLFKAHYKVIAYKRVQFETARMRPPSIAYKNPPTETAPSSSSGPHHKAEENERLKALVAPLVKKKRRVGSLKPTAEEEAHARLLANHLSMLGILLTVRDDPEWTSCDKVGDRVPHDYKPRYPVAQEKGPSSDAVKRRRTMSMIDYRSCHGRPSRTAKSMFAPR
ncbi:hypothetical protein BN946_scf184402.g4 [Trametes cinnabarina]|uniref:Fungal-type protein kinase domain-containing protein n=1 Tax=Pycnoporus cinnabarinus TaxID=5643 RepID=A0A060SWK4_PYCCI|nr:hypothetical protein BN946_scf184402.g4 [Trametes cinnabarina]